MRGEELVFLGWPDIAGLTRGRGIPLADLEERKTKGIGWAPVAQALTPFSTLAPNPWGPMGDIWLVPDMSAAARVDLWPDQAPFHLILSDGVNPALSEQIGLKQIRLSRRFGSEPFRPPVDAILPGRQIGSA